MIMRFLTNYNIFVSCNRSSALIVLFNAHPPSASSVSIGLIIPVLPHHKDRFSETRSRKKWY